MAFQKQVQPYPARGVTGMQAGNNPIAFVLPIPLADEGGVIIGRAAWWSTAGKVKNTGAGAPLGGQVLFAKTADGTLVPGTAGGTVSGAVETPWTITESAAAGEIFHASAWYAKTVEVPSE